MEPFTLDTGATAWILMSASLVLLMTPGLSLFYGGMVRARTVLNMMLMSFTSMGVVAIAWVLGGYSIAFGSDIGMLFGNPLEFFGLNGTDEQSILAGSGVPFLVAAGFQMTFAIISTAIISGAVADRIKLGTWMVFAAVWVLLVYAPLCHMVWGGGLLGGDGVFASIAEPVDFAGGTVVHINAGIAGLVLAVIVGARRGFGKEPMKPHNLTLTMIGAGLLWVGWYGFNVGSIVFGDDWSTESGAAANLQQFFSETGRSFTNTTVATMAAMLGWLIVERILHGKATSLGAASGIVAGLVAITPAAGAVDPMGAIALGAIAGAVCAWAVGWKFKLGFDDSLDVVGVHLVGGIVGTILIGVFSTSEGAGGVDGLLYGGGFGSLGDQTLGALVAIAWSGVMTAIIGFAIKFTLGWRISEEDEVNGIDLIEHGESAYDLHNGVGGSTSVLAKSTVTEGMNA